MAAAAKVSKKQYVLVNQSDSETEKDDKSPSKVTTVSLPKDGNGVDKQTYSGELEAPYVPPKSVQDGKDGKAYVPRPLLNRAVAAARGSKTLKPIVVTIAYSQAFGCDASGLSNVTADITPWSNTTEWAAWTALYSEYRMLGAKFHFNVWARQSAPPFQSQMMMAVGFDPTSSALPGGVRQITELSQHVLLGPRLITAGATVAADVYGFCDGIHKFDIVAPKGAAFTGSGAVYTSVWQPTATPIPFGALKLHTQTNNVSTNIVVGIVYCRVEFRSRAM